MMIGQKVRVRPGCKLGIGISHNPSSDCLCVWSITENYGVAMSAVGLSAWRRDAACTHPGNVLAITDFLVEYDALADALVELP